MNYQKKNQDPNSPRVEFDREIQAIKDRKEKDPGMTDADVEYEIRKACERYKRRRDAMIASFREKSLPDIFADIPADIRETVASRLGVARSGLAGDMSLVNLKTSFDLHDEIFFEELQKIVDEADQDLVQLIKSKLMVYQVSQMCESMGDHERAAEIKSMHMMMLNFANKR